MTLKSSVIRLALAAVFFAPAVFATAQVGGAGGSQEKAAVVPAKTVKASMADLLIEENTSSAEAIQHKSNKARKIAGKSEAVLTRKSTVRK